MNHLITKLGKLTDIVIDNIFQKYFVRCGGLGPKSDPSLIDQPTTFNQALHCGDLTYLFPMNPFSTPFGFLMFSWGREMVHWQQMG